MNISSINSYNYTSFGAKKQKGKFQKEAPKAQANEPIKRGTAYALAGLTALGVGGMALVLPSCESNANAPVATEPSGYYETAETTSLDIDFEIPVTDEATPAEKKQDIQAVASIPQEQREKVKFHTIRPGDMLTAIVIEYAELDENTPYEQLLPYIERLRIENPALIKKKDQYNIDGSLGLPEYVLLYIDTNNKLRVDGIFPENIIKASDVIKDPIDEAEPSETAPTEPIQITSPNDTVKLNGREFSFDIGTMNKEWGDYSGLMYGKYVVLDKKIGGQLVETRYVGSDSSTFKSEVITYDKNGKVEQRQVYGEDNKVVQKYTYEYYTDTMIVTLQEPNIKSGYLNKEIITYELGDDFVLSKEFCSGNDVIIKLDFDNDVIEIKGAEYLRFDDATFIYDENAIGSGRYYGRVDGQIVRVDVLKNGICIEYLDSMGNIASRQQFDAKGNLIYEE